MKRMISSLLFLTITALSTTEALAATPNQSQIYNELTNSIISEQALTKEQASKVEADIATLAAYVDTSAIESVSVTSKGNEYTFNYNGVSEIVELERDINQSITILSSDGEKSNEISFTKDGGIILDGYRIQLSSINNMESKSNPSSRATIWKGVKSLSPYGSKKASDYKTFLSSGKQNIGLGKALNALTITALSSVIGSFNGYTGIAVSLSGVAKSVYDTLVAIKPKTKFLGCSYTTYTSGASDYKYINKFYANKDCTGSYSQKISYEHFTVY